VTRLERKGRKNKAVAKKKKATIKLLNDSPVIKNVDVEKIKEEFKAKMKDEKPAKKKAAPKKKEEAKEEAPKAEAVKKDKEEKSED
ncbi:MAG: hypothetical protein WBA74_19530, partial [Cyclobacteriaceae bacterium]